MSSKKRWRKPPPPLPLLLVRATQCRRYEERESEWSWRRWLASCRMQCVLKRRLIWSLCSRLEENTSRNLNSDFSMMMLFGCQVGFQTSPQFTGWVQFISKCYYPLGMDFTLEFVSWRFYVSFPNSLWRRWKPHFWRLNWTETGATSRSGGWSPVRE